MVKGYSGADRALAYLFDHATEVSFTQILSSGTPIGTITIDGVSATIYQQASVGNVKDVLVDGVSVVDANGDAQLSSSDFGSKIDSGHLDPSVSTDCDLYLKTVSPGEEDMFGTPLANSGDGYEISTDSAIYNDYYAFDGFGTNHGWGKSGQGAANLVYHFTSGVKYKPKTLSFCNNFDVVGGYLQALNVTFQGSNDGTNWTSLYICSSYCERNGLITTTISTNTYFEYFRFSCSNSPGYTGLRNIVCLGESDNLGTPHIEDIYYKENNDWLKYIAPQKEITVSNGIVSLT